jgi:hypothetical protein
LWALKSTIFDHKIHEVEKGKEVAEEGQGNGGGEGENHRRKKRCRSKKQP